MERLNRNKADELMRINKFLAECGLASRRNCETLVTGGRVKINGKKVTNLATEVNEEIDLVSVDGKSVKLVGVEDRGLYDKLLSLIPDVVAAFNCGKKND